ncbi:MAG: oligosaccharide flippase family protein, partial [Clostridia bacterium]|nr:oligosaccharide flippase family protein [Clostridia bacterium]
MGKTKKFILNAVLLSCASIAARAVSVAFNARVAVKVGAECMGLFSLVSSVFTLCVLISSAGVNLAVVRAVSGCVARAEETGGDPSEEIKKTVRAASFYCLVFGVATGVVVFTFSHYIGCVILGDARCILSLKAFALSLPAISLAACLSGYFTGAGKIYKNALGTVLEEALRITFISSGLVLIAPRGIEYACLAVVGGGAAAQGVSLLTSYLLYVIDKKGAKEGGSSGSAVSPGSAGIFRRIASMALPVAAGGVARNLLVTLEHLAIPRGLKRYGLTESAALSVYGVFHGMVIPVVMFPSSVLYSFASLLIPELSACREIGDTVRIRRVGETVFRT